jgi:hypothetical protein
MPPERSGPLRQRPWLAQQQDSGIRLHPELGRGSVLLFIDPGVRRPVLDRVDRKLLPRTRPDARWGEPSGMLAGPGRPRARPARVASTRTGEQQHCARSRPTLQYRV